MRSLGFYHPCGPFPTWERGVIKLLNKLKHARINHSDRRDEVHFEAYLSETSFNSNLSAM